MKKLYTILLLGICGAGNFSKAQTMKNVLFIGNSFTGANDLQSIVHQFFSEMD